MVFSPQKNLFVFFPACLINGSLYSEGSALSSSSLCEFCYCVQGQQRCIKPHCAAPEESCIPSYSEHSCCPTHYDCSAEGMEYNFPIKGEPREEKGEIPPPNLKVPTNEIKNWRRKNYKNKRKQVVSECE